MKGIIFIALCTITSVSWAKTPNQSQIIEWISNSDTIVASSVTPDKVDIMQTIPIKLQSGEHAYLSAVEYADAGRNFSNGYILTRPKLHESRHLEQFAGQQASIKILSQNRTATLLQLTSAGSGQGTLTEGLSIVSFDGWQAKQHFDAITLYSDGGYSDNSCTTEQGTVNFIDGKTAKVTYSLTSETATDCNNPKTFKKTTKKSSKIIDW